MGTISLPEPGASFSDAPSSFLRRCDGPDDRNAQTAAKRSVAVIPSAAWQPARGPWLCVPVSRRVCPFEDAEETRMFVTPRGCLRNRFLVQRLRRLPRASFTVDTRNLGRVARPVKPAQVFFPDFLTLVQELSLKWTGKYRPGDKEKDEGRSAKEPGFANAP